jgi:hypothetical protein
MVALFTASHGKFNELYRRYCSTSFDMKNLQFLWSRDHPQSEVDSGNMYRNVLMMHCNSNEINLRRQRLSSSVNLHDCSYTLRGWEGRKQETIQIPINWIQLKTDQKKKKKRRSRIANQTQDRTLTKTKKNNISGTCSMHWRIEKCEGVSKSFRTGRLERKLQMVRLSATRCNCTAISWVSLVRFAAVTLCVASQRVRIVVYFVIDSVRKLLDTPSSIRNRIGKVVPVLNEAPRHEDILEEWRYSSTHSWPRH